MSIVAPRMSANLSDVPQIMTRSASTAFNHDRAEVLPSHRIVKMSGLPRNNMCVSILILANVTLWTSAITPSLAATAKSDETFLALLGLALTDPSTILYTSESVLVNICCSLFDSVVYPPQLYSPHGSTWV